MQWNDRFAKWKREGMGHFRQQNAVFNELLNIVRGDINICIHESKLIELL